MFPSSKWKNIPCPKEQCSRRMYCLFGHDVKRIPFQPSMKRKRPTGSVMTLSNPIPSTTSTRVITESSQKEPSTTFQNTTESTRKESIPSKKQAIHPNGGPVIETNIFSRIRKDDRQKALDKFYVEFCRIYRSLPDKTLAATHAVEQEQVVYAQSVQTSFMQRVIGVLMRLRKRKEAEDETDVGIDSKWIERKVETFVPIKVLETALLQRDDAIEYGYPLWNDLKTVPAPEKVTGIERICNRCTMRYKTSYPLTEDEKTVCQYHFGRTRYRGSEMVYTCCMGSIGTQGCEQGPHVFKLETDQELHELIPFTSLVENDNPRYPILSMDCEMSYTLGGMECVRVSVVDWFGNTVMDEIVKPSHPIVCFNTRFSGIQSIENGMTLDQVHKKLSLIASSKTILLGHSLENDLRCLRIQHERIIDTTTLFPHPKKGNKHALRYLVDKELGRFIQTGQHSSIEDAIACLDLVKKWIKQESLFQKKDQ